MAARHYLQLLRHSIDPQSDSGTFRERKVQCPEQVYHCQIMHRTHALHTLLTVPTRSPEYAALTSIYILLSICLSKTSHNNYPYLSLSSLFFSLRLSLSQLLCLQSNHSKVLYRNMIQYRNADKYFMRVRFHKFVKYIF
jgi:hypothetical protein